MNKKLTRSSHRKKIIEKKNEERIITKVKIMVISTERTAWGASK